MAHDALKELNLMVEAEDCPSVQYLYFNSREVMTKEMVGLADVAAAKKTGPQTSYAFYSITKTFTALAILQLMEKGKLALDQPLSDFVFWQPYSKHITLRHLLSHSSGIPNPIPLNWIHLADEHAAFDQDAFFKKIILKYPKALFTPGEKYAYSNLGYVLLGEVIRNVSGLPYEEYILQHIIRPLGLSESELTFKIPDYGQLAKGYHRKLSLTYWFLYFLLDRRKYLGPQEGGWVPFKPAYVNGSAYGGLIGTAEGLMRYAQELLKGDNILLGTKGMSQLFEVYHTRNGKSTDMCLAWFKGSLASETFYCHAGGGGGYYSELRLYPGKGQGSLILLNRTGLRDERLLNKLDPLS